MLVFKETNFRGGINLFWIQTKTDLKPEIENLEMAS